MFIPSKNRAIRFQERPPSYLDCNLSMLRFLWAYNDKEQPRYIKAMYGEAFKVYDSNWLTNSIIPFNYVYTCK